MRIETEDRVKGAMEWIEAEKKEIEVLAGEACQIYWARFESAIKDRDKGYNALGCRWRVSSSGGINISWFYHQYYVQAGKRKRTNVHIKKPTRSYRYNKSTLTKKCSPDMVEVVEYVEDIFEQLRRRSEKLVAIKARVSEYEKIMS